MLFTREITRTYKVVQMVSAPSMTDAIDMSPAALMIDESAEGDYGCDTEVKRVELSVRDES